MGTGYTRNDTSDNIASGKVASASDIDGEFDAIVAAFNESSGHDHDGTSAGGAPITVIGPAQDFVAGVSDLKPKTDSAYTLGTSSNRWSNVYSDSANVDGDITVTGTVDGRDIASDGAIVDAVAGSSLIFISSSDISGAATVDFTGFDATKYDSYLFTLMNVAPSTDNSVLYLQTSSDGGSSFDSLTGNYYFATTSNGNTSSASATRIHITYSGVGNSTDEDYSGVLHVVGPHLSKYTRLVYSGGYSDTSGLLRNNFGVGERKSTSAVNAIRFYFSTGNIASGTISMYGVKNA